MTTIMDWTAAGPSQAPGPALTPAGPSGCPAGACSRRAHQALAKDRTEGGWAGHRMASGPGRSGTWAVASDGVVMTRDHQEVDLGLLADVTDRGLRHHRNEDAMELAVAQTGDGPVIVAVVCDGVSTSTRPEDRKST